MTTQECSTFIWGGCHGNSQNRFDTEMECLAFCIGGNSNEFCLFLVELNLTFNDVNTL